MLMVDDMIVGNGHLPPADTGANVRHPVVVADMFVLVIWIGFTGLRSVEHNLFFRLGIRTNQCPTARRSDDLITVER